MGTTIEAVTTSVPRPRVGGTGAIVLADDAARACLERAGRDAAELDFLINAGVYHDNNLYEPALAAIIQEDIGANPRVPTAGGHGTFSFDVNNGACGVLNGVHILDGFLASGAIDLAMVVASDADPELGSNWDFPFGLVGTAGRVSRQSGGARFPYPSVGGAVLLSRSADPERGFSRFAFATFPEFAPLHRATVTWEPGRVPPAIADRVPGLESGSNVLHIEEAEAYAARAAACAVSSARGFLDSAHLAATELDLVIASPAPAGFASRFARDLGLPAGRVAEVAERHRGAHTAGVLAALEAASSAGRLAGARNVLFAAVAAGITVGLALYHP